MSGHGRHTLQNSPSAAVDAADRVQFFSFVDGLPLTPGIGAAVPPAAAVAACFLLRGQELQAVSRSLSAGLAGADPETSPSGAAACDTRPEWCRMPS